MPIAIAREFVRCPRTPTEMETAMTPPRTLLLIAILALPCSLAASAHAQFGGRSAMVQAVESDVLQRDLPIFAESLQLEEWQRPIMDMLLEDYLSSFNAGIEAMKQRMQGVQVAPGSKPSIQDVLAPLEEWSVQKKQLYAGFLQSVKSQLSPQQLERWPVLERALRRERLLPQALLSAEGINLIGIMQDLAPPPEVALAAAPALEQYELRLDEALQARQARMNDIVPALKEAMSEMNHDRGVELQERITVTRVALREVQERSIEEVATAMGADWGERFRTMAMQRAYPEAFQPSPVMRQYVAALALTTLSDEQRTTIASYKGEFQTALDALGQEMLAAIRKQEPKEVRRRVEQARQRREGNVVSAPPAPEQGSVESVRLNRAQTNEKYRELLEAQLTPEQYQELPGAGKMSIKSRETKSDGATHGDGRLQSNRPAGRNAPGANGKPGTGGGERPNPASIPSAPSGAPSAAD